MTNFFVDNLYSVILFPMWVFAIIIVGRFFNVVQSKKVISLMTLASTLYGFVFAVGAFISTLSHKNFIFDNSYSFLKIQDFQLNVGVYLDNLSALMLLVVTSISFVVQLFSSNYMKDDRSFARFFAYLNLFNFSMLGLVLSPNLFQNYIFWELVGVSSYLLIGFWYKKPSASFAAKKAFIMNRIGDFGLLIGTIVVSYYMYQFSSVTSLATVPFTNLADVASYLYSYTDNLVFIIICLLLLMGSFAKSAQFPLHTWLADAMEGPTPVSALIHSATMVAAGVYLVARLYPIYALDDTVMTVIASIGLITAFICAFFAITQTDIKRILAYSTNSQLGLMFLALGLGAFSGGLFHLTTHAFFKSMLFLCSGIVIHCVAEQQDIRFLGGLRKVMPFTALCYFVACLTISGVLFSGFYSKEMMISSILDGGHIYFAYGFWMVSLMTAFYMFRSYFLIFEGEYRGSAHLHKTPLILNLSIFVLLCVTLILGTSVDHNFANYLKFSEVTHQMSSHMNPFYPSICVALAGIILSFILYSTKIKPFKIPVLYKLSYNKLYIDGLYDKFLNGLYALIARICAVFDKYIVDGLVIFSTLCVRALSWVYSKMQTGSFQSYIAYSVAFLAIVFAGLMLVYTMIIQSGLISAGGG